MPADFVHLHCHSEYSILDGACRITDLVQRAVELELPAVVITDHGSMAGALELYRAADAAGIKAIVGCEVYLVEDEGRSKSDGASSEGGSSVVVGDEHYCSRTDRKPGAGLTKVGTDKDGADLWVEGTPQPGTLGVVLWTSPFGNLWSCNNRVTGPYGANEGDPEWEDPTTDADREQYPWCF